MPPHHFQPRDSASRGVSLQAFIVVFLTALFLVACGRLAVEDPAELPINVNPSDDSTDVIQDATSMTLDNQQSSVEEFGPLYEPESERFAEERMFRKPDLFLPLTDPSAVSAANTQFSDDSEVLGVVVNGVARAYSIRALYHHHVINDLLADRPIVITYCGMCSSGTVFNADLNSTRMIFAIHGAWQGVSTIYDKGSGSLWLHMTGECFEGELRGKRLSPVRVFRHVLWREWKRDHPNSTIVLGNPKHSYPQETITRRGSSHVESVLRHQIVNRDRRYPHNELLFGVVRRSITNPNRGEARAYPFTQLRDGPSVINDFVGTVPVVIVFDKRTNSATGFGRKILGKTLNFKAGNVPGKIVDKGTSSVFTLDGECIAGEYNKERLPPLFGAQAEWYGWFAHYPNTTVYTSSR